MKIRPIFTHADETREQIRRRAIEGIQGAFPFVGNRYTVDVENVKLSPKTYSPHEYKKALMEAKTMSEPIRGTLVLRNSKTGKVMQKVPKANLLQLPYFTDHHTFVIDGNSYTVSNQLRMKPGVYTRKRRNDEIEATFNLSKGDNFRMSMDPEKGHFNVEYGTTRIPLHSVLRGLNVSDKEMGKHWGSKLVTSNRDAFSAKADKHIDKLYEKMIRPLAREAGEDKMIAIKKAYGATALDPDVTRKTLGTGFSKVTPQALLEASGKLLRVYKSKTDYDERDNIAFKHLKSVDDFVKERIALESRGLRNKILMKLERGASKGDLERAMPASPFTKTIRQFLATSSLSGSPTQINPMEIMDQAARITSLGEGGISTERAIPMEARQLHTSHIAVLDPIRTPESSRAGIDLRTAMFTGRDDAGNIYTELYDTKRRQVRFVPVEKIVDSVIAFPIPGDDPPTGKVDVIRNGKIDSVPASQVDFVVPSSQSMYSPAGNMIPFIENIDGNRATMGAKMVTQALPLVDAEAPFVRVGGYKGSRRSMERQFGTLMVPTSPVRGTVTAIRDGFIHVRPDGVKTSAAGEGSKRVPIYENFPLASKTFINHVPTVKVGDKVYAGQSMAQADYVKDGVSALGKNLLTAYIPMRGMNSNDALVISETAAKKMTSKHMFRNGMDLDADLDANLRRHKAYYGNKYTKDIYDKLGDDGVVKPGMKVRKGDLLIAAVQKSQLSPEAQMLGKLHKSLVKPYRDAGLTWERDHEGTVVDVVRSGKKIRMTVKVEEPMNIGDKLCFTEDAELLTKDGWKWVPKITLDDLCYTLNPKTGQIELQEPVELHEYPTAGTLYELESQQVDLRVTTNHDLYIRKRGRTAYELAPATEVIGKRVRHLKTAEWCGDTPETFTVPASEVTTDGKGVRQDERAAGRFERTPVRHWLRFLGAYLANGSTTIHHRKDRPGSIEYRVVIHTVRGIVHSVSGDQHTWLKSVLDECSFPYTERDDQLIIHSKQLALHFSEFGHAKDKWIPRYVFSWGKDAAEWILEGLLGCDGHKTWSGSLGYTTVSPQLADDVQQLALHVGWAANITTKSFDNPNWNTRHNVKIVRSKCRPQVNHGHARTQNGQRERIVVSDEPVYGVTVPNGILYVRVNGKPVFTGNSGRHGNKGVVSRIVPDAQMMKDARGRTIDLAVSPATVVSRINPAQILETAAAKVAEKTGKPVIVPPFSGRDNLKWVKGLLKEHDISDTEEVLDPETGKKIPGIMVGPQYTYKLFKSTDTNFSARGVENYDVNLQPSSGGPTGAKGIGRLVFNALLAHDARNILHEAATLKSQKNDEWWRAYQLGLPLPHLKTTFAYDKFGTMLAGSGVKMNKDGNFITLGPLVDKDVTSMSRGEITKPLFVRAKDLRPERGGLFDPVKTGGTTGTAWSHFTLREPTVNPVFERPARTLLGMTGKKFEQTLREEGGQGIKKRLSEVDLPAREKFLRVRIPKVSGSTRDNAIKELKYIRTLRKNALRPEDAYVISKVPVAPPVFRPILPGKSGNLQVSDANWLYRDAMLANDLLGKSKDLPPNVHGDARKHLYDTVSALYGTKEPTSPQLQSRQVKGFLARIAGTGSSPKRGFFHSKLLKRKLDLSGRGTIVPDSTLAMDEVGLPEEMAWSMYQPFLVRNMVQKGYKAMDARDMIKDKHPLALQELTREMKQRPVLLNRAPSLYRYNILAAYPKLVPGKTIRIHELQAPVMAGDFDGDAQQVIVPVGPEAVAEARRMTLPNMLITDQEKFKLTKAAPQQESIAGIYMATGAKPQGMKKIFKSRKDAVAAYNRGEITLNTPVEIKR